MSVIAGTIATDLAPEADVAHHAFDMALISDQPIIFFRRRAFLRWEASSWVADRVTTTQATYTYAKLIKMAYGFTRWGARRALAAAPTS